VRGTGGTLNLIEFLRRPWPPAARYYNAATGRFLSRDPEDGKAIDPKTLHKYLYAGGDPVNRVDPRGRDIIGFIQQIDSVIIDVASEELVSEEIDKILLCVAFDLLMEYGPADTKFPWWYCELGSL